MIGYGLVNSAVHEICLNQIIVSFLSRSSIFLANFYLQNYIRQLSGVLSTKQEDDLINLFLEEEKYIAIQKNIENPDPNFNPEEIVYKYLLTANIISNKDYNYDLKTTEQVISDGKKALKNIFFEIYQKFLSNLNQDVGNILKLPDFEQTDDESKNFLLNLIKYSTFIFMNYSVAEANGDKDKLIVDLEKTNFKFNEYGKTSYSSMASEVPDIEYDYTNPKQKVFNYFTSAGKFFNYGEIKPLLFGEFYYSIKQDKIEQFSNEILLNSPELSSIFLDLQKAIKSTPIAPGYQPSSELTKKYKYLQELGYFIDIKKYFKLQLGPKGFNEKAASYGEKTFFGNIPTIGDVFGKDVRVVVQKVTLSDIVANPADIDFLENTDLEKNIGKPLILPSGKPLAIEDVFFSNYSLDPNLQQSPIGGTQGKDLEVKNDKTLLKIYIGGLSEGKLKKLSYNAKIFNSSNWKNYFGNAFNLDLYNQPKTGETKSGVLVPINLDFSLTQEKNESWPEKQIVDIGVNKYFTLSFLEILKYYKFSFPEMYKIVSAIKLLNKNIEDYFNLGYRLNLNLNADITKDQDWSNHHIYELFNIPFKQPPDDLGKGFALKLFNKYPPFYENLLFKDNKIEYTKNEYFNETPQIITNLLYNSFFINFTEVKNIETIPALIEYNKSVELLYSDLLKQVGINGSKLPKDNPLFKMLFGKENLLFTINNYDAPQFKINYFITVADFIVNTGNQDIYFSATGDAKESQFLIKKTYYQTVLNQLLEVKNSSDNNNIKYVLDSYKFDELKKLSEQYDNFEPTYNYKVNMDKIYDFYNGEAKGKSYNLLTIRDTSLKILDAQIKVLENG